VDLVEQVEFHGRGTYGRPGERATAGTERSERDVEADGRAAAGGADLHEVADLVDHPQSPPAELVRRRAAAADERVPLRAPTVLDLAHERPAVDPDPQGAGAAAVADGVGGQLADGQHDVVDPPAP